MITSKQITDQYNDPTLTAEEEVVLKKLETLTDNAIQNQFRHNHRICVSEKSVTDTLGAKFGYKRNNVILKRWRELCEKHGWEVDNSGYDDNDYYLSPK